MVKKNAMGKNAYFDDRGILIEGDAGSYWVSAKFTCTKKGFVVQKITKRIFS